MQDQDDAEGAKEEASAEDSEDEDVEGNNDAGEADEDGDAEMEKEPLKTSKTSPERTQQNEQPLEQRSQDESQSQPNSQSQAITNIAVTKPVEDVEMKEMANFGQVIEGGVSNAKEGTHGSMDWVDGSQNQVSSL